MVKMTLEEHKSNKKNHSYTIKKKS